MKSNHTLAVSAVQLYQMMASLQYCFLLSILLVWGERCLAGLKLLKQPPNVWTASVGPVLRFYTHLVWDEEAYLETRIYIERDYLSV